MTLEKFNHCIRDNLENYYMINRWILDLPRRNNDLFILFDKMEGSYAGINQEGFIKYKVFTLKILAEEGGSDGIGASPKVKIVSLKTLKVGDVGVKNCGAIVIDLQNKNL
jgi:hypothetical protein